MYFTNDIVVNPCNHTHGQAQGTNEPPAFTTQAYRRPLYKKLSAMSFIRPIRTVRDVAALLLTANDTNPHRERHETNPKKSVLSPYFTQSV